MNKSVVFKIHSITGLVSGLFILLISLSGAVLVFHDELDRLEYPPVVVRANSKIIPVDSCYKNLKKEFPNAQINNCQITQSNQRSFVFTIYDSSYKKGKEALRVFMQPQNGGVQKIKGADTFITNWFGRLHGSFFLGKTGEWLLGFFALVFLPGIITGTILYRKNFLAVLSFQKRVFKRKNLHQLIGVYAFLFNLMIAITGFWMQRYVFKKDFYKSSGYTPVIKTSPDLFFSMDSLLNNMKERFAGFTPHIVYFAQSKKGTTVIYGSRSSNSFIHSKKYADVIYLDSAGRVGLTAFVSGIDASKRYDIINAQIHYGQYGGLPVKIIYFLFGLTSGVLSVTGFLLWLKGKKLKRD
jgi:uncharacterized iron-regulated membrane protein